LPLPMLLQHNLLLLLLPLLWCEGIKVSVVPLLFKIRYKVAVGTLLVGFRWRLRAKTLVIILGRITQHSRLFIFHVQVDCVVVNALMNPGGQACWTKPWAR